MPDVEWMKRGRQMAMALAIEGELEPNWTGIPPTTTAPPEVRSEDDDVEEEDDDDLGEIAPVPAIDPLEAPDDFDEDDFDDEFDDDFEEDAEEEELDEVVISKYVVFYGANYYVTISNSNWKANNTCLSLFSLFLSLPLSRFILSPHTLFISAAATIRWKCRHIGRTR